MSQDQTALPWRTVGLAVLPGAIFLATPLIAVAAGYRWSAQTYWLLDAPTLLAALAVIVIGWRREKRLPLWSLFPVGLSGLVLLEGVYRAGALFDMNRDEFNTWYAFFNILGLILAGLALLGGALAARRYGGAAALIAAGLIGAFMVDLFDPTYGLLVIRPDQFSPLGVALLDLIGQIPLLILLPVAVLRARSERGQVGALLGGYGLSLLVMLLLSLLHDFALQGVSGAPPLAERLLNVFIIRPLFLASPWLILALITLLYSRLKRGDSTPPAVPMALRPEPAP